MDDPYQRLDFSVEPSKRGGIALMAEVRENIRENLMPLEQHFTNVQAETYLAMRRFFAQASNEASAIVGNHAFNDFEALLESLINGDGRNAARVTRALYEHVVNYCDVATSTDSAERYIAHRSVTAESLSTLTRALRLLKGVEHSREKHRLKKLSRESAPELRESLRRYGSGFRRGWAATNLRQSASNHGYESQYEVYKLLSQVTHGSFGGVLGNYGQIGAGNVHRVGLSLDLAVLCYVEGLGAFQDFAREVATRDQIEMSGLVQALDELLAQWPTYRSVLQAVDGALWPSDAPSGPVAIVAVYPSTGRVRWFYWEPELKVMRKAFPPDGFAWLEEEARSHLIDEHAGQSEAGKPLTSAVSGVILNPEPGSKWFPAEAILTNPQREHVHWLGVH
ncbi:DUF5677 domain-containing protein [Streptomyces sp. AA1529]|uniref:DUF5677 domain-containing protein n=1 Tax=Streptomyces sp. AA1529 TaxID=1203257 RepID=UPI003D75C934